MGAGRCLFFDGVHDYVDLGNIYDSLIVPITVTAWIYLDTASNHLSPIFVRQDPEDDHDELIFFVTATQIVMGYGNGVVASEIPVFRRSKAASLPGISGRWVHVAGIIGGIANMELFVNGINLGGSYTGNSNLPIIMSHHDETKIGYWFSGQVDRFKGMMDEVQVWNRALTEEEIRNNMCRKLTGNEPGLVGYWNFDETLGEVVNDKSPSRFDGRIIGNPQRIFSGAAIGDESIPIYPSSWEGQNPSLEDGLEQIRISNVRGNPEGAQLYVVRDLPSQQEGLNLTRVSKPYFGVFISGRETNNSFDVDLFYQGVRAGEAAERTDNSNSTWTDVILSARNVSQRAEFIRQCPARNIQLDLGPDKSICDQTSYSIDSGNDPLLNSIKWSTGETTPEITVNKSGMYSVVVGTCDAKTDSVRISFYDTPPAISLGDDIIECTFVPKVLKPLVDSTGFEFTWQDGSKKVTFDATGFGIFWVVVSNSCGISSDTLAIHQPALDMKKIPNVITPNGDQANEFFEVEENLRGQVDDPGLQSLG